MRLLNSLQTAIESLKVFQFLSPLAFRLILAWVFFWAGYQKIVGFDGTAAWFASMGYPLPELTLGLVIVAELVGGICLLIGLAVRWWTLPLLATMAVAIITVHWEHGWYAIAQSRFDNPPAWATDIIPFAEQSVQCRVSRINEMIAACGNPQWITEGGRYSVALLQNGVEMAALYFAMLLSLLFTGAGAISLDYIIRLSFRRK